MSETLEKFIDEKIPASFDKGFKASDFFDVAQDLLCIIGFDGYSKFLSPSWSKLLGFSVEELASKKLFNFIHPDDREATIKNGEYLKEGGEVVCFINRYICRDGGYRWLFWNVKVIDSLFYCLVHDITEQRLVAERTSSLQNAKLATLGQMLGCIAHEINNPLAVLGGLANDLALASERWPPDRVEVLRVAKGIDSTVKRIAYIVSTLRNFARDGTKDPFISNCVNEMITSTLAFCNKNLRSHGIDIELEIPSGITVDCQGVRISQIILNLVNNALDAV